MNKQFIATSLKEIKLTETESIYRVDEIITGTIDAKTNTLTDSHGRIFLPINEITLNSNKNYYCNTIESEMLTEIFSESSSYEDAVETYTNRCKEKMFLISKYEDSLIKIVIDKGDYISAIEHIKGIEEKEIVIEEEKENSINDDSYIELLLDLKTKISMDKYTEEELIDIKSRLTEQKEELEATLETIEIKLESIDDECKETESKPEEKKSKTESIDIVDVFDKVTKTLIAQDEPARRVIVELARLDEMRKKGYGILLTGESGVGKSLFMSLLARHLDRPLLRIDSTQLTAPGYVGRDIEQYLWELYESCNRDIVKAERAIVFFDEIDKKGSEKKSDISGQAVINTLLTFITGEKYIASKHPNRTSPETSITIDTSNMLIVAGGAFLDVYSKEKPKTHLGFVSQECEEPEEKKEPEILDFIEKAKMPKEFMGRVPIIVRMNSLDLDSLRKILLESDESVLKMQEEIFEKKGVKLTTQDGYIMSISQAAIDRKIGARGLNKLICDTTWIAYDDVCSHPEDYKEIILTEETVKDPSAYQYVKRNNS